MYNRHFHSLLLQQGLLRQTPLATACTTGPTATAASAAVPRNTNTIAERYLRARTRTTACCLLLMLLPFYNWEQIGGTASLLPLSLSISVPLGRLEGQVQLDGYGHSAVWTHAVQTAWHLAHLTAAAAIDNSIPANSNSCTCGQGAPAGTFWQHTCWGNMVRTQDGYVVSLLTLWLGLLCTTAAAYLLKNKEWCNPAATRSMSLPISALMRVGTALSSYVP